LPRSSCKWAIFAWKIDIVFKLPEKIEFFQKFAWKNQNSLEICLEKSKFFVKLPEKKISWKFAWKNRIFLPGSTIPKISN